MFKRKVVRRRLRKAGSDRGDRFDENGELEAEDLVLNRRYQARFFREPSALVYIWENFPRLLLDRSFS